MCVQGTGCGTPCGKGKQPACPDPGDPPACFPTAPNTSFGARLVEIESPTPNVFMFGRPLAAAPVGEDIVLAVGARTGRVFIFYLEFSPPTALPVVSLIADIPVGDSARKLAVADFNGDTFPDFVVAGFGPVELIMSDSGSSTPSYPNSPITILNERGDSIDATNEYVAVGVKGGKRDPGEVHIFGISLVSPVLFSDPTKMAVRSGSGRCSRTQRRWR